MKAGPPAAEKWAVRPYGASGPGVRLKAIAKQTEGNMRRPALAVGVPALLCMIAGTCWASESAEPQAEPTRVSGAFWVLPPAYEFPVSGGGHLSLEIGVTPGLWEPGRQSGDTFGPRVGAFVYPTGRLEGLALYVGLGEAGPELGLWCVWRRDVGDGSSGRNRALSFRLGIGAVESTDVHWAAPVMLGLGASMGFSF